MSIKHNINFGLAGSVSVGKSTILNALLSEYLGETKLKRTTYVPFKFINVNGKKHDVNSIKNKIIEINKNNPSYNSSQSHSHQHAENNRNEIKLKEFEMDFNWNTNSLYNCTIIDFPGVNDPHEVDNKMENVLFSNLINLDYLIYVMDAKISLNNKYERNFIENLFKNINECDTLTSVIILFNKYDEEDNEIDELIDEAKAFINEISIKYNVKKPETYKISGRKIMTKNIILKSKNQSVVPENIRHKVYKDYFGRVECDKMMNYDFDKLEKKFNEILYTNDDKKFMNNFYDIFNDKLYYDMKLKDIKYRIEKCVFNNINASFSIYMDSYQKYFKLNPILRNNDKIKIIIETINFFIEHNKCDYEVCKIIYSIIYNNPLFHEKENYFFPYLKKMIDIVFEVQSSYQLFSNVLEFVKNTKNNQYILYVINKILSDKLSNKISDKKSNIIRNIITYFIVALVISIVVECFTPIFIGCCFAIYRISPQTDSNNTSKLFLDFLIDNRNIVKNIK
jgi:hypothetical protein